MPVISQELQQAKLLDRVSVLESELQSLLSGPRLRYSDAIPSRFPESPGIYVITDERGNVIRAGKTSATLRQRLYQNHLMGSQPGNLPAQLVGSQICDSLADAKVWIRRHCSVQWMEIADERQRGFLEHFMLAILEPRFCDKNKQD